MRNFGTLGIIQPVLLNILLVTILFFANIHSLQAFILRECKLFFFISYPKHMFWVLNEHQQLMFKMMGKIFVYDCRLKNLFI